MKLIRHGVQGSEKPGLIDNQGHFRDLSHLITDINPQFLTDKEQLHQLTTLNVTELPRLDPTIRLGACINQPGKIICVGYNSKRHNQEMGIKSPTQKDMIVFMKPTCCISGPFDPIYHSHHTQKLDWEAELGVVIGKKGKYIPREKASEHIFGYLCINDLSERHLQFETEDTQYTKGKCFDGAAPIGPFLATKDEIADAGDLQIKLWVNDALRQNFNTRDYIHNDAEVISYLSNYFTLYPGDIISMGSAPGNAKSWGNQFLQPTDRVVFSITGLGQQEHVVMTEPLF